MLAIDIETYPNDDMLDLLPDVKASKTLKDPAKIEADIAEKKQEQIDKMALSPLYGKIACIGIYGKDIQKVLIGDEKEMLEEFFKIIHKKMVVTWNGKEFDFDFIFKRAIVHKLKTLRDMKFYTDKYKSVWHTDLMQEFCKYGQYLKLDDVAKVFLGSQKLEFDVTKIKELLKTEDGKKQLCDYCLQDTKLTYELALAFGYSDNFDITNEQIRY